MDSTSISALIGISITLFASLYSSDENFWYAVGIWLIGLAFIGYWFLEGTYSHLEDFAMILVVIGQLTFWGVVHYIKSGLMNQISIAIIFILIVWTLAIIIFYYERIYYYKRAELESEFYSSKVRTRPERKSFSRYVKDEILERQQNRCAMCNDKLFYPHFDHIDGNRSNNSLSNCQALCPNCHELKTRRDQKEKNDRF